MKSSANQARRAAAALLLTLAALAACALLPRASSAQGGACTRTVTNTNDTGAGSLRQAITDANAAAGADTICFNIPASDPRHFYYADDGVAGQVSQASVTATTASNDSSITGIDPDWPHSWWSVQPASLLPTISGAVTIDGYTQPGASQNTLAAGDNAVLRVELDGTNAGFGDGLVITAGNSTVRGLVVNRFATLPSSRSVSGVALRTGGGNHLEGNFIGTDASGTVALGNEIGVAVGSSDNVIGGTAPAQRNLISGNSSSRGGGGVELQPNDFGASLTGNLVQGNFIGTNAAGAAALGNKTFGVRLFSFFAATGNVIGGVTAGARNIISGNNGHGVMIQSSTVTNNSVQGNYIGTDVTGAVALGNTSNGIYTDAGANLVGGTDATDGALDGQVLARNVISGNLQSGLQFLCDGGVLQGNYIGTDATGTLDLGNAQNGVEVGPRNAIGGDAPGAGNVISGNNQHGILLFNTRNTVRGNLIGTNAAGTGALGNSWAGVIVNGQGATDNVIGGTSAGQGNTVAFNGAMGVSITCCTTPVRNSVLGNSVHSNGGLGIDLDNNNVTPNDAGDADSGTNDLQNYPVLASAASSGGATTVTGTLNSLASTTFRVEFFSNSSCDTSGNGEGQTFIGSTQVTTDAGGNAPFTFTGAPAPSGQAVFTATATRLDASGNPADTSEFSACLAAAPPPPPAADIRGRVTLAADGSPVANVTVNLSGAAAASTATDAAGFYAFNDLAAGTYTVTPSRPRLSFSPAGRDVALSGADVSNADFAATPSGTNPQPANGAVIISELRLSGATATDEYVELYNNTDSPADISGFQLDALAGLTVTVPAGTTLPARGHYLIAHQTGYTLSSYAAPDQTYSFDLPPGTGLALYDVSGVIKDAVGFGSSPQPYREGNALAAPSGSGQYAYARSAAAGNPADAGNNAADFYLVAVEPGSVSGPSAVLGAPGPENLASPVLRNAQLPGLLLDSAVLATQPPNRVRDFTSDPANNSTFGTLSIRRTVTNNTGAPVTRLRFRVSIITTSPAPSGTADLRVRSSPAVLVGVTPGGNPDCPPAPSPCALNVVGLTLEEPPAQPAGGGYNSSLRVDSVTPSAPLAPGARIHVNFLYGLQRTGAFKIYVNVEALP